jgi:predicted ABC-type exoprotein transport system permease subunit
MSREPGSPRAVIVVRILALVTVLLGLMCVALALAWQDERQKAACWRIAAEFQQQPEGGCGE